MRLFVSLAHKEKFVVEPSSSKIVRESPSFLQRVQGYVCQPIHLPSRPFRYYIVLIDVSACGHMFVYCPLVTLHLQIFCPNYEIKSTIC